MIKALYNQEGEDRDTLEAYGRRTENKTELKQKKRCESGGKGHVEVYYSAIPVKKESNQQYLSY